jgi:hypothetical protein
MGLFKKLSDLFAPPQKNDDRAYWLYVQCNRCGEVIRVRVDLYNDLSPIYEEAGVTYFCRKVIIGQERCYQKIELEMTFTEQRKLVAKEIQGGRIITADDYSQALKTNLPA